MNETVDKSGYIDPTLSIYTFLKEVIINVHKAFLF